MSAHITKLKSTYQINYYLKKHIPLLKNIPPEKIVPPKKSLPPQLGTNLCWFTIKSEGLRSVLGTSSYSTSSISVSITLFEIGTSKVSL